MRPTIVSTAIVISVVLLSLISYRLEGSLPSFKWIFENANFMFSLLGLLRFGLPMVAFQTTSNEDWQTYFIDCFTPYLLLLDLIDSIVILAYLSFFTGNVDDNFDGILIEFVGLTLTLVSIHNGITNGKNDLERKRLQSLWLLIGFAICGLVTLLQLQFKWTVPENRLTDVIVALLFGISLLVQGYQCGVPIFIRLSSTDFTHDSLPIFQVKMYGTVISFLTSAYDIWSSKMKGYWFISWKQYYMCISIISLCCALLTIIGRFIGPQRLRHVHGRFVEASNGVRCMSRFVHERLVMWMTPVTEACTGMVNTLHSLNERLKLFMSRETAAASPVNSGDNTTVWSLKIEVQVQTLLGERKRSLD